MNNRKLRLKIAHETVEILDKGLYANALGQNVEIKDALDQSKSNTKLFRPNEIDDLIDLKPEEKVQTKITVHNCTTLYSAKQMVDQGESQVLCLNFASAKNPGGGFLGGSQAQEECLARASGLYYSLLEANEYYEVNRSFKSSLYTDHMIHSPSVPIFRNDEDQLLDDYYKVSFITAPAANKGALMKNQPDKIPEIQSVMKKRIRALFSIAHRYGYENLVLGAWGCGVFRNDPKDMAQLFADEILEESSKFHNVFKNIDFAVLDSTDKLNTFNAFQKVLG